MSPEGRRWSKGRFVGAAAVFFVLAVVLALDAPKQHPSATPGPYYAEVTFNAPYGAADPGGAVINYNSVTYYIETSNKAKYLSLLSLDGSGGGVWSIAPAAGLPAEWNVSCSGGDDVTVWSTVAPGFKQAARAYCDGTFGPGIGQ